MSATNSVTNGRQQPEVTYIKMRRENGKRARANGVSGVANDNGFVSREVGDLPLVLLILRVAKGKSRDNLVLLRLRQILNRAVC
jgi:hypothetical protein